jgi:hypothetical protein
VHALGAGVSNDDRSGRGRLGRIVVDGCDARTLDECADDGGADGDDGQCDAGLRLLGHCGHELGHERTPESSRHGNVAGRIYITYSNKSKFY